MWWSRWPNISHLSGIWLPVIFLLVGDLTMPTVYSKCPVVRLNVTFSTIGKPPVFSPYLPKASVLTPSLPLSTNPKTPNLHKNHGEAPTRFAPNNPKNTDFPTALFPILNHIHSKWGTRSPTRPERFRSCIRVTQLYHDWLDDWINPVLAWQ